MSDSTRALDVVEKKMNGVRSVKGLNIWSRKNNSIPTSTQVNK